MSIKNDLHWSKLIESSTKNWEVSEKKRGHVSGGHFLFNIWISFSMECFMGVVVEWKQFQKGKRASKFTQLQNVLSSAHTFWGPWLSINASSKTPYSYPLTFLNHLSYSIFKIIPSYGAIFWQNCCKPLLVRPQCRSLPIPIVSSKTRYKGWQLAPRVGHGKHISSCTGNKIQCCQLHAEQFKQCYLTPKSNAAHRVLV